MRNANNTVLPQKTNTHAMMSSDPVLPPKTFAEARKHLSEIIEGEDQQPISSRRAQMDTEEGAIDENKTGTIDQIVEKNEHAHMEIKIDYYPYLPYLVADADDHDSIKHVVLMVLLAAKPDHDYSSAELGVLTVTPIIEGNSNKLFRVSGLQAATEALHAVLTVSAEDSVLVRIFGAHGLVDRDMETSVHAALARQNLAFRYYGRFANGRLEEWCPWPTVKAMTEENISDPTLSKAIAVELAHLHYRFDTNKCSQPFQTDELLLWKQLDGWLASALDLVDHGKFKTNQDNERARSLNPSMQSLKGELQWLRNSVINDGGNNSSSTADDGGQQKVGFCHNDVLASNILWNGEMDVDTMKVRLIDFEYGGWNYFCYDIANHFNEFAGGTAQQDNGIADYSRFPSPQFQRSFCREYLAEKAWVLHKSQEPIKEVAVEELYQEVQGFILANHLVWCLWAVNSAAANGCEDFDYLTYAQTRLTRYLYDKDCHMEIS